MMQAAHELKVHLGWIVASAISAGAGEPAAAVLMLPTLGISGLRARRDGLHLHVLALAPVVILLVTLLGATLSYPL
jgi:hypothetical protein